MEYLYYLSKILSDAGHRTFFLTCDAAVPACYSQLLKEHGKIRECPRCILGGVRSFPVTRISSISKRLRSGLDEQQLMQLSASSSFTIHRTETEEDCQAPEVENTQRILSESVDIVHGNARAWIRKNNLDGVFCFNGRMELTHAITLACEDEGIPFVTVERPWFGHGLQLNPNGNCLSLKDLDRLSAMFRDQPLTKAQARLAAKIAAGRFLQRNVLEWRVYNPDAQPATDWPGQSVPSGQEKVLILPSSQNEFGGHKDWATGWTDFPAALGEMMGRLRISPQQCVLRCHPNWAENIGKRTGILSESHYRDWARRKGVHLIRSNEKINTYDLIRHADLVLVNGSSTGLEAAVCGKKVVCLGQSRYRTAGFCLHITNHDEWHRLEELRCHNPEMALRRSLRYIYVQAARFPQFVNHVRSLTTTRYRYYSGADVGRLTRMLETGSLEPDDPKVGDGEAGENDILQAIMDREWVNLDKWEPPMPRLAPLNIGRSVWFSWVDGVRSLFPRGDR